MVVRIYIITLYYIAWGEDLEIFSMVGSSSLQPWPPSEICSHWRPSILVNTDEIRCAIESEELTKYAFNT